MSDDPVADRLNKAFGPEFAPGDSFDLAPLHDALARLGNPHTKLPPTFHLAGTNGKGSTGAFIASIAAAASLRAHVFSKPHVLFTRERVQLANATVSDEAFLAAIDRVAALKLPLRHFEAQVAAAFLLFSETPADLLVLETGMGGTLDATNVIERPAVSIITPIDLDHVAALGGDLLSVAAHKAGIIKPRAPVIVARQKPEVLEIIEGRANECDAPLLRCGAEWDAFSADDSMVLQTEDALLDLPLPSLPGAYQVENAGAAIMALRAWGNAGITEAAIAAGLRNAWLPARLQRLRDEIWLDGAHNPHGARALATALRTLNARAPRETVLIVGILARKDAAGILSALRESASTLIAIPIADEECTPPAELARIATSLGFHASAAGSLQDAVAHAANTRIVICGSLAVAGEAFRLLND